jgi:glycosyltransferase involved in cell wall biosynthesis
MVLNGVSVVTTTWNERENIEKLVPSMRNVLQRVQHEIVVVDDNSPDETIQIANNNIVFPRLHEKEGTGMRTPLKRGITTACSKL